jgi:hypothetical protein
MKPKAPQAPKRSPSYPGAVRGPVDSKASEKDTELPHERDETTGPGEGTSPDPAPKQAYKDLESGQADTDLRGTARQVFKRSPKAGRTPK